MLVYNTNYNKTTRLSEKIVSPQKSVEGVISRKSKTLSVSNKNFLKSIGFKLKQK